MPFWLTLLVWVELATNGEILAEDEVPVNRKLNFDPTPVVAVAVRSIRVSKYHDPGGRVARTEADETKVAEFVTVSSAMDIPIMV